MSLNPGITLGTTYEIVAPIGANGMGEVYRARDTKLGPEVAIKVLREAFAENKAHLARFELEARLLASLNHPNIATLFDLQKSDGTQVLVLEYVPTETLAEINLGTNRESCYDITPDGRRFVIIQGEEPQPLTEIRVILNWYEELKRLVSEE
jgi:serine/threonine protein kinase